MKIAVRTAGTAVLLFIGRQANVDGLVKSQNWDGKVKSSRCKASMVRQAHHEWTAVSITLSESQTKALDFIRSQNVSLLFGDTGAGKSEIYMKRMDEILSEGKRCLLLLPEISLTPQMEKRFRNHFGDAVVLWHSKMTPKQKKIS